MPALAGQYVYVTMGIAGAQPHGAQKAALTTRACTTEKVLRVTPHLNRVVENASRRINGERAIWYNGRCRPARLECPVDDKHMVRCYRSECERFLRRVRLRGSGGTQDIIASGSNARSRLNEQQSLDCIIPLESSHASHVELSPVVWAELQSVKSRL